MRFAYRCQLPGHIDRLISRSIFVRSKSFATKIPTVPYLCHNLCLTLVKSNPVLHNTIRVAHVRRINMAFSGRFSPFVRSSLSLFRTAVARRTLTSQSKESASYFRFAGPFIGASTAAAGLFAASKLYDSNFTLFRNVHASAKVGRLADLNIEIILTVFK